MSCLTTLAAFVILSAGFVIFGLGQLCELGMYLLECLARSIGLI
jgi:hypothetical protein